jgi:hypothetical protein
MNYYKLLGKYSSLQCHYFTKQTYVDSPSGNRQFNPQQFYVLHTQCICVFFVDLRTSSDYFPVQL